MNKEQEEKKDTKRIMRASISAVGTADYDFECIAVPSENGQINYDYSTGEYFNQVLKTNPENIKRERLDSGLPLFDNHPWNKSVANQLGITVAYKFVERGIWMGCKWGARADQALRDDVANGIVKTVSIEGSVDTYEITRNAGELPTYSAILWEPESLSFAPVPNDIQSQISVKRSIQEQIERSKKEESTANDGDSAYSQLINKF